MYTLTVYNFFKVVKTLILSYKRGISHGYVYLFVIFCIVKEVFKINKIHLFDTCFVLIDKKTYKN